MKVQMNPRDVAEVKKTLSRLAGDEANKAMVRGINKTMTGVRTDGVKMLKDHYALTASAIRKSWRIRKALFRDPHGVVSSKGTFVRLKEFGARETKTGVSVKVLRTGPRKVVKHAFFATLKQNKQVYWRKWSGPRKAKDPRMAYGKLPMQYRFPVKALYGPRIQDHLGDPQIIGTLTKLAGQRLSKNMAHEVDYLLGKTGMTYEPLD
jgi:hypothetical protein